MCLPFKVHTIHEDALAANHRPSLENLLVSGLPFGILCLEGQSRINHHGQVSIVFKADGDAMKIGVEA